MSKIMLTAILIMAAFAVFAQSGDKATFTIGSEVTDYPAVQWLKGTPVTKFDKKKIYIVECWATWCYPCVQSIPHLNDLHKKFGDKITIIGQNVYEDEQDKVENFVKEQGDGMSYHVAYSGKGGDFTQKWLMPAKVNGIPYTFVIQDNKIVWMPHPAEISEEALQLLLDRKFTVDAANALSPIKQIGEVAELMNAKKLDEADAKLKAILARDPKSHAGNQLTVQLLFMQKKNEEAVVFAKNFYDKYPEEGTDIYYYALDRAKLYDQLLPLTAAALKKQPEDEEAIQMRYKAFAAQKDYKKAAAMIREATASGKADFLTLLAALNQYTQLDVSDPEVEAAMLAAGKKALSLEPASFKLMMAVARLEWKKDKQGAKATVAKCMAVLKADPQQAKTTNLATQVLASLDKDVFPDDKQLQAWYQ